MAGAGLSPPRAIVPKEMRSFVTLFAPFAPPPKFASSPEFASPPEFAPPDLGQVKAQAFPSGQEYRHSKVIVVPGRFPSSARTATTEEPWTSTAPKTNI